MQSSATYPDQPRHRAARAFANPFRGWASAAVWAFVVLLCLAATPLRAQELLRSVELFEDVSGQLTAGQVLDRPFKKIPKSLAEGYSGSVFWIRLRIDAPPSGRTVVLEMLPRILEDVEILVPNPPNGWTVIHGNGSAQDHIQGVALDVPPAGRVALVRIRSEGSINIHFSARPLSEAMMRAQQRTFVHVAYLSAMIGVMLWSIRMAFTLRASIFAFFAVLQVVWVVQNMFYLGLVALVLPGLPLELRSTIYRTSVLLVTFLSVAFHRRVIGRFSPPRPMLRLFDMLLAGIFVAFMFFLLGERSLALHMNAYFIILLPFVLVLTSQSARRDASPGLKLIKGIYLLLAGTLFVWVFTILGVGNTGQMALLGPLIHGCATGGLMFALLRLYGRSIIAGAHRAKAELELAQARQEEAERHRSVLSQFIDMLAHETRNALSVITMSLGGATVSPAQRKRAADTIAGLNRLLDRSSQVSRLEGGDLKLHRAEVDLAAMIEELRATLHDGARIDMICSGLKPLWIDPVMTHLILTNLLENALKYSPPDSRIEVALSADDDRATVDVTSREGPAGLPDPEMIFGRYYRHPQAQSQQGSGLGLYLSRRLAGRMGGTLDYRAQDGAAHFTLGLPCRT